MSVNAEDQLVKKVLSDNGVTVDEIQRRSFPGESWLIVYVDSSSLPLAQSIAGSVEAQLNQASDEDAESVVVAFRSTTKPDDANAPKSDRGRLFDRSVDQLIQLLEARSRTSDALPSLRYVEDPRASLAAACASRHHIIYGRRGVGKTALLLEAKRWAEAQGYAAAWVNAHTLRDLSPQDASLSVIDQILAAVLQNAGTSTGGPYEALRTQRDDLRKRRNARAANLGDIIPELNTALRAVLREDLIRLYVFLDDFYLFPLRGQPSLLDHIAAVLRDCNGWIKVASIERLSRPFEPSTRMGLEIPHDATRIDLDVTLEEPAAAQAFLERVLSNYLVAVGISSKARIAKREALGRLVLASGGVPRDYLNLIAASIVVARQARTLPREIGKEDVAVAAGSASRSKKRDLEQDVDIARSHTLLGGLETLTGIVKGAGYTFFRVSLEAKTTAGYEVLSQLADLRFAHLVQAGLSDKHAPGVKYEAYVLDLSEYSDVRLKRGLHVLDLIDGKWTWRLTGHARKHETLSGTQLRDQLRSAPEIEADMLAGT